MPLLMLHEVAEIIRWKRELGRVGAKDGSNSLFPTNGACIYIDELSIQSGSLIRAESCGIRGTQSARLGRGVY